LSRLPIICGAWGEEAVGMRIIDRPRDPVRAGIVSQDGNTSLDRLERDPAVALEDFAGTRIEARIVEALAVEMPVDAVELRRDPSRPRSEKAKAEPSDGVRTPPQITVIALHDPRPVDPNGGYAGV
jgi:hypothetical protein